MIRYVVELVLGALLTDQARQVEYSSCNAFRTFIGIVNTWCPCTGLETYHVCARDSLGNAARRTRPWKTLDRSIVNAAAVDVVLKAPLP